MQHQHHRDVSDLYYVEGNLSLKILVCGPDDHHTFSYIYRSFKEMGHETRILDSRYDYLTLFNEVKSFSPDFLLIPRQGHLYETVKKVQEETGIKTYLWNTDCRGSLQGYETEFGKNLVELFRIVDCVYTVAIGEVEMFETEGIKSKWLVQGIWPEVDNKLGERYEHTISFLGSIDGIHEHNGGRTTLLRELYSAGYALNLEPCYGTNASRCYYESRINLGHAHSPRLGENSVRDFKIMGSGGFLLTQWYQGIDDLMNVGAEMDCYNSIEECLEKVKYYLEHTEEREKIAQAGYEACHDKHKYSDRLQTIIEDYKNA